MTADQNRENYNATSAIGSLSILRVCTATETVETGFPLAAFDTETLTGTCIRFEYANERLAALRVIGSLSSASHSLMVWPSNPSAGVIALPSTSPTSRAS